MHRLSSKWRKPKTKKSRVRSRSRKNLIKAREVKHMKNVVRKKMHLKGAIDKCNDELCSDSRRRTRSSTQKATAATATQKILEQSATSRKFSLINDTTTTTATTTTQTTTSDDSVLQNVASNENFLINSSALQNIAEQCVCKFCQNNSLNFKVGQRNGFAFTLQFVCNKCGEICMVSDSSRRLENTNKSPYASNRNMVQSFVRIGVGFSSMEIFCSNMNMRGIALATYHSHLSKVKQETIQLKEEVLKKSRKIVREVHQSLYPNSSTSSVIDILCSFDGSWQKRGFTSLFGIGFAIDVLTGLVIDYEVLSKYCHTCVITANDLGEDTPDFDIWHKSHVSSGECDKNFSGSSGSMELNIAEILWRRSISECQMCYKTLLSDGDAKTFKHLNSLQIYAEPIEKEECINHVAKRLSTALREVVKTSKSKGVTLGGKALGALTDKKIATLATYYRTAIRRNQKDVNKMRQDILATVSHCSSTDKAPNHNLCPAGKTSWCFYNRALANKVKSKTHSNMQVYLNEKVVENIMPIYERLSNTELLNRCTQGLTQNANEAIHSVLWRKCSKTSSASKNRVEIAAAYTVAEYNLGYQQSAQILSSLAGSEVPENTKKICQAKDDNRKRRSDIQNQPEAKRARVAKKNKTTRKETSNVNTEGPTYGKGLF